MVNNTTTDRILKETGVSNDMIIQYHKYLDSDNKQGQKRLLCRLRKIQNDALKRDREKLACLDYIIARVEKTERLSQNS